MKERVSYGVILLEMTSVLVAIVLGFAVTRWQETQQDRARAAAAMERIEQELQRSRTLLVRVGPYYDTMAARVDSLLQADGDADLVDVSIPGLVGLGDARFTRSAFDLSMSTGALEHVDFRSAVLIANAYEAVEEFERVYDGLVAGLLSGTLQRLSTLDEGFHGLREMALEATVAIDHALGDEPEAQDEESPSEAEPSDTLPSDDAEAPAELDPAEELPASHP